MRLYKGFIVSCVGMALLFSGCTSKKNEIAKDFKMEDLTLRLNKTDFTLYQPISSVTSEDGWLIDENDNKKIEALGRDRVELLYGNDKDSYLSVNVYNPKEEEVPLKEALILGVNYSSEYISSDVTCVLPDGLKFGTSTDSVLKKLHTPYEAYHYMMNETVLSYHTNTKSEKSESYEFVFANDKLEGVSLYGVEGKTKPSKNISFQTKKVLGRDIASITTLKKNADQEKAFDELFRDGFTVNGITVKKDTPITAFTSQGYVMKTYNEQDESSVYLEKDEYELYISVSGEIKETASDENKITRADFDLQDVEIMLPANQKLSTLSDQDIIKLYGAPDEIGRYKTHDSFRYIKDDVQIEFNLEEGKMQLLTFYIMNTEVDEY